MNIRKLSLQLAEAVDAWRVVPRLILVCYGWLVHELYLWYVKIPTYVQERCDAAVIQLFIDGGMALEKAQQLACTVIDVVGGPTAAQSAFVTTIIGLSTGIFGLYTSTGRRWDGQGEPAAPQITVLPIQQQAVPEEAKAKKIAPNAPEEVTQDDNGPRP